MIRFFILLGYFALTLYLQLSGKLSHYINLHYSYLVYISMVLSLLLALVQFYIWIKKINSHSHLESRRARRISSHSGKRRNIQSIPQTRYQHLFFQIYL